MADDQIQLEFRPHHFLCTLCYRGEGYSPRFAQSYAKVTTRLGEFEAGDAVSIRVTSGPDSICGFCPQLEGELCRTQEKVERLDEAHSSVLGLLPGESVTWGEAKRLLAERMTFEAFDAACAPCGWKPLGICKEVLGRLLDGSLR